MGAFALCLLLSSCGMQGLSGSNRLMNVQRGMTIDEVVAVLGKPLYRSFDRSREQYEFHRTISGTDMRIFVAFQDGRVVSMHSENLSLRSPQPREIPPTAQMPNRVYVPIYPAYPEDASWFEDFLDRYQRATFDSDKKKLLETAVASRAFTVDQCVQLLRTATFDSERIEILRLLAPAIYDRENSYKILELFSFQSEEAKRLLERGLYY